MKSYLDLKLRLSTIQSGLTNPEKTIEELASDVDDLASIVSDLLEAVEDLEYRFDTRI